MPDAPTFNTWHADVAGSERCTGIFRAALGLPPEVASNSLLTWNGIGEVTAVLRLAPGQTLVDLACGRGGYGREVARRAGARLLGMDFAAVAVTIAAQAAEAGEPARFCVGDFTSVALVDHAADAIMIIDAIQFAESQAAALRECRRVLKPGGRLAVTGWEALDLSDERMPERIRRTDLARDLAAAGFEQVSVTEKPGWCAAERSLWEAALQTAPDPDPALVSLRDEATRTLATFSLKRRVLAAATA